MPDPQQTPVESPDSFSDVSFSFGKWIWKLGKKIFYPLAIGILTSISSSYILYVAALESWIITIICSIQFVVIFMAIALSRVARRFLLNNKNESGEPYLIEDENDAQKNAMKACGYEFPGNGSEKEKEAVKDRWKDAKNRAVKELRRYKLCWNLLWIFWLLLYAVFALLFANFPKSEPYLSLRYGLGIVAVFLNNAATLCIFFCYRILALSADRKKEISDIKEHQETTSGIDWHIWVGIWLTITIIEIAAFVIVYFIFNESNVDLQKKYAHIKNYAFGLSGVIAAVATALFAGRLDSKFLDCPGWFLSVLYFYAAIQPLIIVFEEANIIPTVLIINAALIFKCFLYLYMTWLFDNGRLLFYFVRMRLLSERVKGDWDSFSAIIRKKRK